MSDINNTDAVLAERLAEVLRLTTKFHYNVGTEAILARLFPGHGHDSYIQEKAGQIQRKGFEFFFNELDLERQRMVAEMMVDRYPALSHYLSR